MRLVRGSETREVHLEGLVVRDGASTRRFVSPERAREAYARALEGYRADGYVDAPDPYGDLEARRVLADELLERGDVQGELIAVQDSIARGAGDPDELDARFDALLEAHHDALFGELAAITRHGRRSSGSAAVAVTWVHGFAEEVRIHHVAGHPLHATYAALARLPLARQIRSLVIGPPGGSPYGPTYTELVHAMLDAGIPPHLRAFRLGDGFSGDTPAARIHAGDLRPLIAAMPHLTDLFVGAGHGTFGPCDAPHLARLTLHAMEPIELLRSTVPSLVELELAHTPRTGAFLAQLARSPLLAKLRGLRLIRCGLGDSDLATLAMHEPRFRHLATLHLRGDRFTQGRVTEAREDLPRLVVD